MKTFANLDELVEYVQQYEWFCSTGLDKYNRFVVYVNRMDFGIIADMPPKINNKQVLFHFYVPPQQYINNVSNRITQVEPPHKTIVVATEPDEVNIQDLILELDRLEKICGSNVLQDVFYEVHDGKNAVTNWSVKFPEVRSSIENLYSTYGFDLIYEELDG